MTTAVALCARSFSLSTWIASGTRPIASPPATVQAFDTAILSRGLVWLTVHGQEGDPHLRGDDDTPLLHVDDVRRADCAGALVYLAGCYGAPQWTGAFLEAGAAAVVGDRNEAWTGRYVLSGSNLLGWLWRRRLEASWPAWEALADAMQAYGRLFRAPRDRTMLETVALYGDPQARLAPAPGRQEGTR